MFYNATRRSAKVTEIECNKIGYVRIWTMIDKKFHEFLTNYVTRGAGKDTDAMIYDVRDGFGGRPEGFYEAFFAPEYTVDWHIQNVTISQITGYQKPLILMTNPGTRSAKEVVSNIFKLSKRATVLGGPTAGDVLGTTPYRVADWAYLEIPMVDLSMQGERLEKNPVKPDVDLGTEFDKDGEDLYLAAAYKEAVAQSKSHKQAQAGR